MSVNKIKSLKLSRHNESTIKLEDDAALFIDETKSERGDKSSSNQDSLTPVHGTPKRSASKSNCNQERQLEYRRSPVSLSCTQDGINEVAWDWQSPLAKSSASRRNRNNGESHIGTPKRATLLQKKRNSNSPLLYKPIKRKLIRCDNKPEGFATFTAEMRALSEQIKTVPRDEINREVEIVVSENVNESDDSSSRRPIDIVKFAESAKTVIAAACSDADNSSRKNSSIFTAETCLDDLFDDSIEDSMVKCSQEVEEKLRLESCRGGASRTKNSGVKNIGPKDFSWHQQSYTNFLASREKSNGTTRISSLTGVIESANTETKISSSEGASTLVNVSRKACEATSNNSVVKNVNSSKSSSLGLKNNSNSSSSSSSKNNENNNEVGASVAKSGESVGASRQTDIFEMPDDSFDEDFFDGCFDDIENPIVQETKTTTTTTTTTTNESTQSSNRYGKCYASPHATILQSGSRDSHKFPAAGGKKLLLPPPTQNFYASTRIASRHEANKSFSRATCNAGREANSSSVKSSRVQQSQSSNVPMTQNSSRKFFKTKSHSTSSFDDHSSTDNRGKSSVSSLSSSSSSSSSSSAATIIGKSSACSSRGQNGNYSVKISSVSTEKQRQQQQQQQSQRNQSKASSYNLSNNDWSRTNGEDNNVIKNFDRNAARNDGGKLNIISDNVQRQNCIKEVATGSQIGQICTPEEIERKRREAKMKLEMKRKLQARSKSAGLLSDFVTKISHGKR